MKIILTILMCCFIVLGISGCGSDSSKKTEQNVDPAGNEISNETDIENKPVDGVKIGEKFDYNGLFEMTIDELKSIDERDEAYNSHIDFDVKQVIKLSYNYKNIDAGEDLLIDFGSFQIIDEDGNVAKRYFFEEDSGVDADEIPTGAKTKGVYYYCIQNKSNKLRVILKTGIDTYYEKIFDTEFEIK